MSVAHLGELDEARAAAEANAGDTEESEAVQNDEPAEVVPLKTS